MIILNSFILTGSGGGGGSGDPINVASASNGATIVATSSYEGYPVTNAIDGERLFSGTNWTVSKDIWHGNLSPLGFSEEYIEKVDVTFSGSKTINRVDLFTIRDSFTDKTPHENYGANVETFSIYGLTHFTIQYWNGSAWVDIISVTNNNKVWYQTTFSPITTTKVRIRCEASNASASGGYYARLSEIEVWGV